MSSAFVAGDGNARKVISVWAGVTSKVTVLTLTSSRARSDAGQDTSLGGWKSCGRWAGIPLSNSLTGSSRSPGRGPGSSSMKTGDSLSVMIYGAHRHAAGNLLGMRTSRATHQYCLPPVRIQDALLHRRQHELANMRHKFACRLGNASDERGSERTRLCMATSPLCWLLAVAYQPTTSSFGKTCLSANDSARRSLCLHQATLGWRVARPNAGRRALC